MRKSVFLFILLTFSAFVAKASAVDSLWNNANALYAEAQYERALEGYLEIEQSGTESFDLYYNMGNTYYKMQQYAYAILYYEKALRLDPDHADALHNLTIVREQCIDRIEPIPQFFVTQWIRESYKKLPPGTWSVFSLVLLALSLTFVLLFVYAGSIRLRKASFVLAVVVFFLAVTSGIFARQSKKEATREDIAIIKSAVSSVKSAPGAQGKDILVLHEGTKVRVLEEAGEWVRIELEDGRQGWLLLHEILFVY